MKSQGFLTALLMVLVGCNSSPTPSTSQTPASSPSPVASAPTEVPPVASPTASAPVSLSPTASPTTSVPTVASPTASPTASKPLFPSASADFTISAQGIGPARLGMTLGELKTVLAGKAEFRVKSPFIVDFDAIAIIQSRQEQYYILYPAGVPLADSDLIEALVTDNPKYRTAQGVGPGTPIQQAEAVYGDAILSHNTLNESREYVKFAQQSSDAIAFRTKPSQARQFAGIYPSSQGELKETKNFQKTAVIGLVEVYCRDNCPLPSPK